MTYREWLKRNPEKQLNPMIDNIAKLGGAIFPDLKAELDPNMPYEEIPEEELPF